MTMTAPVETVEARAQRARELDASTRRHDRLVTTGVWLCRILVVVLPFVVWHVAVTAGLVPKFVFSTPSDTFAQLGEWLVDGTIAENIWFTLRNALLGYVVGLLAGTLLAMWLHSFKTVGAVLGPFVAAANAIPRIALAPLFVTWFGFGVVSSVMLVVAIVMFISFFAVFGGLSSISENNLLWARSLGANRWQVWRTVRLPSILSWILSSLRVSIGLSMSAAIVSEFVGGTEGIGALVSASLNTFQAAGVGAAIIVTIVMAGVVDSLLRAAERRMSQWIGH